MKKRLALLFLLLMSAALYGQKKPVITVLDFKVDDVSESEMRAIISRLTSSLFATNAFTVINVEQRETLLKEMEFSFSECTDEACQIRIGKMLSAEMIVVGNVEKVGTRFHISAKMLETESAQTISAADGLYGNLDALVDDLPNLALKLAGMHRAPGISAKTTWGVVSLLSGLGSAGVGGYFLWDALTNGKAAIDQAQREYDGATTADAPGKWTALNDTVESTRNRLYWGLGFAGLGVVLSAVGVTLFAIPETSSLSFRVVPDSGALSVAISLRY
jgi:TolB-like protein